MVPRREVPAPPDVTASELQGWFTGRLPDAWFTEPPRVLNDRDEILVVGTIPGVEVPAEEKDNGDWRRAAEGSRIQRFREETRSERMRIADEAEAKFGRVVSWGAVCGSTEYRFTSASVPLMTRLRLEERLVLDTLVATNVARSRSDALAWCVRLVGENEGEWLESLRDALAHVDEVRNEGPASRSA